MTDDSLPDDPSDPVFWEARYRTGHDGWDIRQPAPPFVDLLALPGAPQPGSMIVLGCGRGHDAAFFASRGFSVTAVDFARVALQDARKVAERARVKVDFVEHDLFTLPDTYDHRFTYVLEHTCFSAILLQRRGEYVQLVRRLIAPGGLYIALFFAHGNPGGPPFNTTVGEIETLFGPRFTIERLERPARSIEQRQGQELFALMRPRP